MPTLTADASLLQITEHIADWRAELLVDRANRLVKNVALTGTESVNGYRYSETALREALPHYDGKPVFLDHAKNLAKPFERSTRDLVGTVVNPRFAAGRVRGDIQTLDTEAGRTFVALAESNSPAVGMSHVVLARRNAEQTIVEKIEQVVSIDAVIFPATAATFREQADDDPEFVRLQEQVAALSDERDDLRRRVEEYDLHRTLTERRRRAERLIEESQLPAFAVTELWFEQLLGVDDEDAQRGLIEDRKSLLGRLRVHAPDSEERRTLPAGVNDELLIGAIRGTGRVVACAKR
jgi:hypothetical protein